MQTQQLDVLLSQNPYPGRGIVLGLSEDGMCATLAYFIMGRSENSRNRVFTERDGGIVTEAADPTKMKDPSLIIYAPVRKIGPHTIVTNGDQTDTVYASLAENATFEEALRTRTFEPDEPNFTPRISGLYSTDWDGFSYRLSILKSGDGAGGAVQRFFYEYPDPVCGTGHFLHTYAGDGNPLPSFVGEPIPVAIHGDIDTFANTLWNALNADNKVSLFVRTITLDNKEDTRIFNRFSKV